MGHVHSDPSPAIALEPTGFLGLQLGFWVKILLGWLAAALIGGAGWFLYVRDALAERPTAAAVDIKIEAAAKPMSKSLAENKIEIDKHSEKLQALHVWQAGHAATERAQAEQMADQKKALDVIQTDIKKILRRQNRGDN